MTDERKRNASRDNGILMTNADLIVHELEKAGVRWAFGIPSGPVLPLIDAFGRSSVEYVLTASETSAGFMAAVVGTLTGIPGVCVSTLGPGATNLATGVGCAWLDGAPVVAITCNVPTPWLRRRTQMRIDHHRLFEPLTKATLPLRAGNVSRAVRNALALATTEPPGPVHLDLPEDVAAEDAGEDLASVSGQEETPSLPPMAAEAMDVVAQALAESRRPLLAVGLCFTRLSREARAAVLAFIERQNLPFVSTLHAKGFLPESHPNWMGVIGRARRTDVQAFVKKSDLILALGYDPVEINYEEWVGRRVLLHLSAAVADVSPDLEVRLNCGGDLARTVASLEGVRTLKNHWRLSEWKVHRSALESALRPAARGFAAHQLLDVLRRKLPPDGILAYDVGAHTHQIATQWRTDLPGTQLSTNGWSSMGFGMPAAYAAKMLHPDRAVVGVVGDGCFQMTAGELALARRRNLSVPIIVLSDGWLGLMKIKQERKAYALSGVHLGDPPPPPPHYFGVPCRGVTDGKGFAEALEWALHLAGPSVIEASVDVEAYSETVFD